MTTGVLLFAFNTPGIDYVKIAKWNAMNIQRHLNLPVTLITDSTITDAVFDQVIYAENKHSSGRKFKNIDRVVRWKNSGRYSAYELTPYDQTIVLDVDYVVASNTLLSLVNDPRPFVCTQQAIDVSNTTPNLNLFNKYQMPMAWATVMKFTKSSVAEMIFDVMRMVQHNYSHYALLFGFSSTPYRNDFALSIALSLASGHRLTREYSAPFHLLNVNPGDAVHWVNTDTYEIQYTRTVNNETKPFKLVVKNQDLHVMCKDYLEKIIDSTV